MARPTAGPVPDQRLADFPRVSVLIAPALSWFAETKLWGRCAATRQRSSVSAGCISLRAASVRLPDSDG